MAANKKPRKQYKPKAHRLPIIYGLDGEKKTDLRLPYHLSLEALRSGKGGSDDAHTILSSLLVARELVSQFTEGREVVTEGIDAIAGVKERGDAGSWGVSGEQFRAISEALVLFDDMQEASTRRTVREALRKVWQEAA